MANVWMHNGFLQVEGQKMSKSLGNFVTIHELLETEKFGGRTWSGRVLRLAMMRTHYRSPIDWSVSKLAEAERDFESWSLFNWDQSHIGRYEVEASGHVIPPLESVVEALADDLNTPLAISRILERRKVDPQSYDTCRDVLASLNFLGLLEFEQIGLFSAGFVSDTSIATVDGQNELVRKYRVALSNGNEAGAVAAVAELERKNIRLATGKFAGQVSLNDMRGSEGSDAVAEAIAARLAALNAKDFALADAIRADLLAQGIQLKDAKSPTGERITTWELKR
jgi:cysteinyl-tRNA synthetase